MCGASLILPARLVLMLYLVFAGGLCNVCLRLVCHTAGVQVLLTAERQPVLETPECSCYVGLPDCAQH